MAQLGAFNDEMPALSCVPGGNAFAGCVPIAIAQTMNYFEYPTTYNWADMPNTYGTTTTAELVSDIWEAIPWSEKNFDCWGTGVNAPYDVSLLLENIFNYSSASQSNYNHEIVKQNIYNNKPVILSGAVGEGLGGHMWVCDGMKISTYYTLEDGECVPSFEMLRFHMNWGWLDGAFNNWYLYDNFNPGNTTFNENVRMVYNINP